MAQINKQADARRIASLMRRIGCIDETIEPAMLGRMQESIAESTRLMNEANMNATFTMEQQGLIDKLLKRHFGATSSFVLCGWILRDGTMLNFSYQNHSRDIDHRYIAQARYDKNDNYLTDFDFPDIYQFCAMGNIRLFPMYGFQIGKRPTPEQQTKLMQFIRRCDELDVDISDESGKIVHTIVPTGRPNASLVLDQINKWFDGQEEMSDADSKQDAAETEDTYHQLCNALSSNKKFSTWDGNDDLICVYNAQVHVRDKGDEISVDEFEPVNKGAYGAEDQFLSDLTKYADANNKVIVIEMYKSHQKIKAALKRFGFVENKGRNMNYYYNSGVWYRKPR